MGSGGGAGNQMWNGFIFEVQQEWDSHTNSGSGGCVQVGPGETLIALNA